MKLNVGAFSLAFAIWWGVGFFLCTWWIIAMGGATGEPTFVARVYLGYEISALGSVIGLVWGFFDGLIAGAIFAWLYNFLVSRIPFGAQEQTQSPA
jgi:VIT1/CCC1 family predicted Fe2+/Mn2+ transporter